MRESAPTQDNQARRPTQWEGQARAPEEVAKLNDRSEPGAHAPTDEIPQADPRTHWAYQSPQSSGQSLDALLEVIGKTLKKGEKVTVVGFGSFSVRKREARQGRNPKTGAPLKIPAARTPIFKAGKDLKDTIK